MNDQSEVKCPECGEPVLLCRDHEEVLRYAEHDDPRKIDLPESKRICNGSNDRVFLELHDADPTRKRLRTGQPAINSELGEIDDETSKEIQCPACGRIVSWYYEGEHRIIADHNDGKPGGNTCRMAEMLLDTTE